MICEVCGSKVVDPDGTHRPNECIQALKKNMDERIQKAAREAVKTERRRMSEAIEPLPNRDEIKKLLYPNSEPAKPRKARVVSFSELVIKE